MSASLGEIGHEFLAAFLWRVWPWAACRWFDYHSWVGEPIHDTCKFCGLKA